MFSAPLCKVIDLPLVLSVTVNVPPLGWTLVTLPVIVCVSAGACAEEFSAGADPDSADWECTPVVAPVTNSNAIKVETMSFTSCPPLRLSADSLYYIICGGDRR